MKEHEKSRQVALIKVSDVKFDIIYETRWTHSTLKTILSTHSSGNCLCPHAQLNECHTVQFNQLTVYVKTTPLSFCNFDKASIQIGSNLQHSHRWISKVILARWRSKPVSKRLSERQPITERLQTIHLKSYLSQHDSSLGLMY